MDSACTQNQKLCGTNDSTKIFSFEHSDLKNKHVGSYSLFV